MIVQGFSLAAGVRQLGGNGQSYRGKSAQEHQDQQQSGGQAMHRGRSGPGHDFQAKNMVLPTSMQVGRWMQNDRNLQEVKLIHQFVASAIGEDDNQIHYDKHQVVVPAIGCLSPKTAMPLENLFIDGTEQNHDQAEGG
jgi:hypothetical protein